MSLLRHATVARWLIPLQAMANFFWGLQFHRVESFSFWWRRSAASFRSLRLFFFGSVSGITSASTTGTSSFCAASGFLPGEADFFSSRRASMSWQANVSSWLSFPHLSVMAAISSHHAFISACLSSSSLASSFLWPVFIFFRSSIICCESILARVVLWHSMWC
ncbi:hypothetical protein B7P43_G12338 [Cryptotermes secundus]|uniref:Uncharacterized protein n=1 Tax=Cryptotermes secundus TaxID=105785 RepID=A0A2J7QYI7_9NEOP|nr:hypothetical protein B7P43_G12338 [Cryptotermes secundus]